MSEFSDKYRKDWTSWNEVSEQEKRYAIADKDFWSLLNESQHETFLREADWQELRHVKEAREIKLSRLVSLDDICSHLGLTSVQVYWLMSTRKLPGWLVGGVWKFDKGQIDRWVEGMGGKEAAKKDVEAQIAKHRAAQNAPATTRPEQSHGG